MLTPQKGREGTAQSMAKQTDINNHQKKEVLPVVVSSTGEDIQLSLLSSMSEDVKQQETPIEGKLKIGLPASASVSSSHDKKTGPGKHRRIREAIIFRGMRVSKTRALKTSTAWITRRRRGISLN